MDKMYYWDDGEARDRVVADLKNNQVVLGSSDTVLGLLAPLTEEAFNRLNAIKTRYEKPYLVLIKGGENLVYFTPKIADQRLQRLVERCWPGPLTLILPALPAVPPYVCSPERTIALRVPRHEGLLAVLSSFDGLFSTSANRSGHTVAKTLEEVDPYIRNQVACIVIDSPEKSDIVPSTILDCTQKKPMVVRAGAYDINELEAIYGESFLERLDE